MESIKSSYLRYQPTTPVLNNWGWRLVHAGRQTALSNSKYPNEGHPLSYLFDKEGIRTLNEYQFVFITKGSGQFESKSQAKRKVDAGQILVLFPGEWHRYQPQADTGWSEYWMGFDGTEAARIMATFFSAQDPIISMQHNAGLIPLFEQIIAELKQPAPEQATILASLIPQTIARILSAQQALSSQQNAESLLVNRATTRMLQQLSQPCDLQQMARQLGISYSSFRFAFKRQTGYSPREYHNLMRLNRSKDLLQNGHLTISETADQLGYSSVHYFSRAFKKSFGLAPQVWLQSCQADSTMSG